MYNQLNDSLVEGIYKQAAFDIIDWLRDQLGLKPSLAPDATTAAAMAASTVPGAFAGKALGNRIGENIYALRGRGYDAALDAAQVGMDSASLQQSIARDNLNNAINKRFVFGRGKKIKAAANMHHDATKLWKQNYRRHGRIAALKNKNIGMLPTYQKWGKGVGMGTGALAAAAAAYGLANPRSREFLFG